MTINRYVAMLAWCICSFSATLLAQENTNMLSPSSRFSWDNDFYFFRDAQISNIFSYQQHLRAIPDVAKADELQQPSFQRTTWGFQQTMQTPQKSTPFNKRNQDVPFVGTFVVQKASYIFDDTSLEGYALSVGAVGPLSLAEQTQELVHSIRGVQVYAGWSEQFPTELLLNAHALKKVKLWQASGMFSWDVSVGASAALGNMISQASSDVELRLGYNMPSGFAYIPNTFGFDMHYLANSTPMQQEQASFYASLVLRASAVAHHVYWDGSLFQQAPKTHKNKGIAYLIAGLHLETASYGIHFSLLASSQDIDTKLASYAIGNERIGSLTYDWRY